MMKWLQKLLDPMPGPTRLPPFAANTFLVWEPCTHSHAEVVPGYVRYLLELGYDVAVFITPKRLDEGLFSRFSDPRLTLHRLSQRAIRRMFRRHGLGAARGILITTARKISGRADYTLEQQWFAGRQPHQRLLLVEHDIKPAFEQGALTPDIITLREPHYRNAMTTAVNPHYFGNIRINGKQDDIARFITIGAMRSRRRNTRLLIDAVQRLHDSGLTRFRIGVIGRGSLRGVPAVLRPYFEIKGRIDFGTLYAEMEHADFFLPLLDPDNPAHERYITTGTSGSFQLIYGFSTPCLVARKFAAVNHFNQSNSILYDANDDLAESMKQAIMMNPDRYRSMQLALQQQAAAIRQQSLANLQQLIHA